MVEDYSKYLSPRPLYGQSIKFVARIDAYGDGLAGINERTRFWPENAREAYRDGYRDGVDAGTRLVEKTNKD